MSTPSRETRIPARFVDFGKKHTVSDSEKQLLGALFHRGAMTQADLTAQLPVSQQTVSRMASSLETRGMIRKVAGKANGQRGQPSSELRLNPDYAYSAGVSLMADGIAVTLTDFIGRSRGYQRPITESLSKANVLAAASDAIKELTLAANIDADRVFGVGVSTTGFRTGHAATFNPPESLEELAFVDLEQLFSDHLDLPVWADNDGNTAAIGENLTGVGRRIRNFAYLYIATGVGGGVIVDGHLMKGARGNAGEFVGLLPIDQYVFPNLELLRQYVNAKGQSFVNVAELVEHYDDRLEGIDDWIDAVEPSLSLICSAAASILDAEAIVLGGLIPTKLAQRVIPRIQFFDIHRRDVAREHAIVVPAECPGDASAIGASLLPFQECYFAI